MFQEHCTRAHIECKLRLNNSFVSDFRRNSRRSPSTAISVFFISAPPFEPGIFHGECSQADGNFFFFSISWNLQGGKVELKIIHWNNVDNMYACTTFVESDYTVNDIFFLFTKTDLNVKIYIWSHQSVTNL